MSHISIRSHLNLTNHYPAALKDYAAMNQSIEAAATMHGVLGKAHYGADRTAAMDAAFTAETGMVMKKSIR